jgi:hypothetical protein
MPAACPMAQMMRLGTDRGRVVHWALANRGAPAGFTPFSRYGTGAPFGDRTMPATATRKRRRGIPFERLSKAAKERAIEETQEFLNTDLRVEEITEMFGEFLAERGFPDMKVYWSLSYCQGDGVAFEGSIDMDEIAKHDEYVVEQLARGVLLGVADDDWNWSGKITQHGNYSHAYSMDLELEWELTGLTDGDTTFEQLDEIARAIRDHLAEKIKSLSREMEDMGYKEIEYQTSEEMAKETIEANDYRFDRDGDLI